MATLSSSLKIQFYLGDTHTVRFTVQEPDGSPFDITGASGTLVIHDNNGTVLASTTGSVPTGTDGLVVFQFIPTDTASMTAGTYHYHAKVIMADTSVYTIAVGSVTLLRV